MFSQMYPTRYLKLRLKENTAKRDADVKQGKFLALVSIALKFKGIKELAGNVGSSVDASLASAETEEFKKA